METVEVLKQLQYEIEEKADEVHCDESLESRGYYNSADMISEKINELDAAQKDKAETEPSTSTNTAMLQLLCDVRDCLESGRHRPKQKYDLVLRLNEAIVQQQHS